MLIKLVTLKAIRNGTVSLAFRKWKKPAVKAGSLIKTAVGLIAIGEVAVVEGARLTKAHAIKAGYKDVTELRNTLAQVPEGTIYKISLAYHAEDPRIALRQQATLTAEAFAGLKMRLERLDQYSRTGDWTLQTLTAIRQNPLLKAADLALKTGREKEWLKLNIRKLKNLGLTISHDPGYELSPLGQAYLAALA